VKNYEFGSEGFNVVCSDRGRGQGGPRYDTDGHCVVMRCFLRVAERRERCGSLYMAGCRAALRTTAHKER